MEDAKTGNGAIRKKSTCSKWHWKPEEDILLTRLVQRLGPNNWEYIAKHFLGRTGKSCRLRWVNQLDPQVDKKPFSINEKRRLLELHQCYGNKWSIISKHFPGRTDNQVKNQYHVLVGSRSIRASSPPCYANPQVTPREESVNLCQFESALAVASGSQISNVSCNRDDNSVFDPGSDVTPYRVELPFIESGTSSMYGRGETWFAAGGSKPSIRDSHSSDSADLGYIHSDQTTVWDDPMNSDTSFSELLNLASETHSQQGNVRDCPFIDFFGLGKP